MRPAAKILIVDDEANSRSALAELLHDEGYEVATAGDGIAARARIAELHPDLVLTDVQMPGLDGVSLLAARSAKGGPAFVLMSARPRPHGALVPFVHKPIAIDELVATIEDTLGRR
ncbi:MAG TPA: response regulator [Polyangia bacterium]